MKHEPWCAVYDPTYEGCTCRLNDRYIEHLKALLTQARADFAWMTERAREMEKDAERYRWLRIQDDLIQWNAFPFPDNFEYPSAVMHSPATMLDLGIDAAKERA